MQAAITLIHTLINRYLEGQTLCDGSLDDELRYACDAMILGSLLKTSRRIGIWPMPEAPFDDWKFKNLARKIRGIRILDVCNKSSSRRWTSHGPGNNSHGLEDEIEERLKALERSLDGLNLSDYARNRYFSTQINFTYVLLTWIVMILLRSSMSFLAHHWKKKLSKP